MAWASEPVGGLVVRVAMSRWALYGGGERLDWLAGALTGWVVNAAAALDADCGFVSLGADSLTYNVSPWESAHTLVPEYRNLERWLWGFGWGTLLGPRHLAAVGGPDALRTVSDRVHEVPGGRVWVDLGADPAAVPEEKLIALEHVLSPALRRADSERPT